MSASLVKEEQLVEEHQEIDDQPAAAAVSFNIEPSKNDQGRQLECTISESKSQSPQSNTVKEGEQQQQQSTKDGGEKLQNSESSPKQLSPLPGQQQPPPLPTLPPQPPPPPLPKQPLSLQEQSKEHSLSSLLPSPALVPSSQSEIPLQTEQSNSPSQTLSQSPAPQSDRQQQQSPKVANQETQAEALEEQKQDQFKQLSQPQMSKHQKGDEEQSKSLVHQQELLEPKNQSLAMEMQLLQAETKLPGSLPESEKQLQQLSQVSKVQQAEQKPEVQHSSELEQISVKEHQQKSDVGEPGSSQQQDVPTELSQSEPQSGSPASEEHLVSDKESKSKVEPQQPKQQQPPEPEPSQREPPQPEPPPQFLSEQVMGIKLQQPQVKQELSRMKTEKISGLGQSTSTPHLGSALSAPESLPLQDASNESSLQGEEHRQEMASQSSGGVFLSADSSLSHGIDSLLL